MAKAKLKEENIPYYSKLVIVKSHRVALWLLCGGTYIMLFMLIANNKALEMGWTAIAGPVIMLSLPLIAFPMSESWTYEPWQAKARKFEQNHHEQL